MDLNNFEFWRKNKRYLKALLAGLLSSIVSAFVVALIFDILSKALPVLFGADLLFVAAGYFIGECIRRFGHGVGKKFYVTAAVFTFLSLYLCWLLNSYNTEYYLHISSYATANTKQCLKYPLVKCSLRSSLQERRELKIKQKTPRRFFL